MGKAVCVSVGLFVIVLTSGCGLRTEKTPAIVPREARLYTDDQFKFSFVCPPEWVIENDSYQSIILVPEAEKSWQPSIPADIPRDPRVRIDVGEYVRERLGPAYFPATVDPIILRTWLEHKVYNAEAQGLSERQINDVQAFEITEIYESDCERVIYWRPVRLDSLVRMSTGCQSPYLAGFDQIVSSIRQTD